MAGSPPPSDYDEWEMEERLRHLDRIYARSPLRGPLSRSGTHEFRFDLPHATVPRNRSAAVCPAVPGPGGIARLAHLGLGLGLAVTVCGGCLMTWAHFGQRPDLWPIGVPIAVVGQLLLLIGLVLKLDSSDRTPSVSLNNARQRQLPRSSGQASLRFDDNSDGSPQLTDLAARLDELARKLDERGQ